tara:strand:- start:385 stop:1074 length:690 start_codon:yes stop_codon:yes gene_type:complete
MAVKRGPDGVPIDVPSVLHEKSRQSSPASDAPTSLFDNTGDSGRGNDKATELNPKQSTSLFSDEPPTVRADQSGQPMQNQAAAIDEPATVIAGGRRPAAVAEKETGAVQEIDAMADPVVGWLVIVDGPGKGNYLKLGNGQNSIGRNQSERISLDFGDEQISRSRHAMLTFDPRGLAFYIQQGSGTNLAYLDNNPVLAPTKLSAGSRITLGETTLMFVPLCSEDFSWDEE